MKHFKILLILLFILQLKIEIVIGIVGGEDASVENYGYQVSIHGREGHVCGGAIITPLHVLTAAQCIMDKNDNFLNDKFFIVGGVNDLEDSGRKIFDVEKAYVPLEYKRINPFPSDSEYQEKGDIAVLKLKVRMIFTTDNKLSQIQLPERKYGHYVKYSQKKCIITGFGVNAYMQSTGTKRNRESGDSLTNQSKKLRFTEATVLSKSLCRNWWLRVRIEDGHMCAQVRRSDGRPGGACDGDIGAPLVHDGKFIIGVLVATAPSCNERVIPSLYTRVTEYMSFIENSLRDYNSVNIRVADYRNIYVMEKITGRIGDLINKRAQDRIQ